jgi:tRNA A-37 threonylcarbamoyl transferase component Bud32
MPPIQKLTRTVLESLPRRTLHKPRNWSKAHVFLVEWPPESGVELVVKDLRPAPLWFRLVAGRAFLRREARALRALRDVEGVPKLIARVDADALAMEKLEGRPLSGLGEEKLDPQVLERIGRLLDQAHARGVTHCDLHASNVLVDEQGRAGLIDWATASVFLTQAWGFKRWSFEEWRALDRRALAKIKASHAPQLLSDSERDLLLRGGSRVYRTVKAVRHRMDRLRGKSSQRNPSALEQYVAREQQAHK